MTPYGMTSETSAHLVRQDALRVLREATINNSSRLPSPQNSPFKVEGSPKTVVDDTSEIDLKVKVPSEDL
jgi:hypothetical protein